MMHYHILAGKREHLVSGPMGLRTARSRVIMVRGKKRIVACRSEIMGDFCKRTLFGSFERARTVE